MGRPSPGNEIGFRIMAKRGRLGGGSSRPTKWWWLTFVLCVLFFFSTLVPGALMLISWHSDGTYADLSNGFVEVINNPYWLAIGGMVLLCAMWSLEYTRRGSIGVSTRELAPDQPGGTFESRIRMLSTPLHVAWAVALAALTVALFGLPVTMDWDSEIFFTWLLWGTILAAVDGVVLGSLVRKTFYARWLRKHGGRPNPKPQAFWRWYFYRWRWDLWLCGTATLALAWTAFVWLHLELLPPEEFGDAEDIAEATIFTNVLFVGGSVLLVTALWSCTQFWRAGEDIATGESAT